VARQLQRLVGRRARSNGRFATALRMPEREDLDATRFGIDLVVQG
jgi:hypothetical protein